MRTSLFFVSTFAVAATAASQPPSPPSTSGLNRACTGAYANFPFCDTAKTLEARVSLCFFCFFFGFSPPSSIVAAHCNTHMSLIQLFECCTELPPVQVHDLVGRIKNSDKPTLMTARHSSSIEELGVPAYDWGVNSIHGDQVSCGTNCATNYPLPVAIGASFNMTLVRVVPWLGLGIAWSSMAAFTCAVQYTLYCSLNFFRGWINNIPTLIRPEVLGRCVVFVAFLTNGVPTPPLKFVFISWDSYVPSLV